MSSTRSDASGQPLDVLLAGWHSFNPDKPFGMGMGLSISRSIIEARGGRLWAEMNPAGGSRFHFNLSAAAPSATG